jgi:hypothetical protein
MQHQTARFELLIPCKWKRELDTLARECSVSSSDLARLSIRYLLLHRHLLPKIMRKEGAGK